MLSTFEFTSQSVSSPPFRPCRVTLCARKNYHYFCLSIISERAVILPFHGNFCVVEMPVCMGILFFKIRIISLYSPLQFAMKILTILKKLNYLHSFWILKFMADCMKFAFDQLCLHLASHSYKFPWIIRNCREFFYSPNLWSFEWKLFASFGLKTFQKNWMTYHCSDWIKGHTHTHYYIKKILTVLKVMNFMAMNSFRIFTEMKSFHSKCLARIMLMVNEMSKSLQYGNEKFWICICLYCRHYWSFRIFLMQVVSSFVTL